MIAVMTTDFGEMVLPEPIPKLPMKELEVTRYDEFTGEPYTFTEEYLDCDTELGRQWSEYENHLSDLGEQAYLKGGDARNVKVPPFSQWIKAEGK